MFDDLYYCSRIECGALKIAHGALIVANGSEMCGLYILDGSIIISHASVASQHLLDKSKLWHFTLEYAAERGLVELSKYGLIGSEKLNKLEFCDNCILGK